MVRRRSALGLLGLIGVVVACGSSVEVQYGPGGGGNGATGNTGNVGGTGNVGNVGGTGGTGGAPCYPPQMLCGSACVDTSSNHENCGYCFHPCAADQYCMGGSCWCTNGGTCGACSPINLGSTVPQTATGNTMSGSDHFSPACAAAGSPDVAYLFTAATTGVYVFDTIGSGYDTVLELLDTASCGVLGCDDDSGGNLTSRIAVQLTAGQSVLVVVDGYGGGGGNFALHVAGPPPPPCPMLDLGSALPSVSSGSTASQPNAYAGSCGGDQAREVSYGFTAPAAGTYTFTTQGSSYDTLLYVRDGGCSGQELGCDDDTGGNLTSLLQLSLAAGQHVIVFVDGWGTMSGSYVLQIMTP